MRFQRVIVFALGEDASDIAYRFKRSMEELSLDGGELYPRFLQDIISVQKAVCEDSPAGIRQVILEVGDTNTPDQIARGFEDQVGQLANCFRSSLNQVNNQAELVALRARWGAIELDQWIRCYVIAPLCDDFGRTLILEVLELIHREYDRQLPFQTSGILLLPGLYEGAQEFDRELYGARTYVTLQAIDRALAAPQQYELREELLGTMWLVDSHDESGRFVGHIGDLKQPIAEALSCMACYDMADERSPERDRFYSAFGFSQLVFPREKLHRQLTNELTKNFLEGFVLRRSTVDRNEIVLDVGEFTGQSLRLEDYSESIRRDENGKSLIKEFRPEVDLESITENFIQGLEQKSEHYDERVLPQVKKSLIRRAREVAGEKRKELLKKIAYFTDCHECGLYYALAFLDELMDKGSSNSYMSGERIEEKKNVVTVIDSQKEAIDDTAGTSDWGKRVREIERQLDLEMKKVEDLDVEIAVLSEEQVKLTQAADTGEGTENEQERVVEDAEKRRAEIEVRKESLGTRKEECLASIDGLEREREQLRQRINVLAEKWASAEARRKAYETIYKAREEKIERTTSRLRSVQHQLESVKERLSELGDRNRWLFTVLVKYGFPGISTLLLAVFSLLTIKGMRFSSAALSFILLVAAYCVTAGWVYYSKVYREMKDAQKESSILESDLQSGKSELIRLYGEYYEVKLDVLLKDTTITQLEGLGEQIEEIHSKTSEFVDRCVHLKTRVSKESYSYPQTPFRMSAISEKDGKYFFDVAIPSIRTEISRFFAQNEEKGSPLSFYLEDEQGFEKLSSELAAVAYERFFTALMDISIEDLVFEDYQQLSEPIPPERRISALREAMSPLVQLKEVSKRTRDQYSILSFGVEDRESTKLKSLLAGERISPSPLFFPHRDPYKIVAASVLSGFASRDLSQIEAYRHSYESSDSALKRSLRGREHEEGTLTAKIVSLTGRELEIRKVALLANALGVLAAQQDGVYFEGERVGQDLEECSSLLKADERLELCKRIEESINALLNSEEKVERARLQKKLIQYGKNNKEIMGDTDKRILAAGIAELAPIG